MTIIITMIINSFYNNTLPADLLSKKKRIRATALRDTVGKGAYAVIELRSYTAMLPHTGRDRLKNSYY